MQTLAAQSRVRVRQDRAGLNWALVGQYPSLQVEETQPGLLITFEHGKIFVPPGKREDLLADLPNTHSSAPMMIANAIQMWWWSGLKRRIQEVADKCTPV